MNDYIAYDEKNMDVIKDINNIINIHHKTKRKQYKRLYS